MGKYVDPHEELANAIIVQAVKDYRDILSGCSENKLRNKKELEAFFRSEYFTILTKLDGEVLMDRLHEEYREKLALKEAQKMRTSRYRRSTSKISEIKPPDEESGLLRFKNCNMEKYSQIA